MAVRHDGNWEGWLDFFLRGVAETAEEATTTAGAIVQLRERDRAAVQDLGAHAIQFLDYLYERPVINVASAQATLHVSWPTANKLVQTFVGRWILQEMTGLRRNRVFRYQPYLQMFAEPAPMGPGDLSQATDLTQSTATSLDTPASSPE